MNKVKIIFIVFTILICLISCKENNIDVMDEPSKFVLKITDTNTSGERIKIEGFVQNISNFPIRYKIRGPFFKNFSLYNLTDHTKEYFLPILNRGWVEDLNLDSFEKKEFVLYFYSEYQEPGEFMFELKFNGPDFELSTRQKINITEEIRVKLSPAVDRNKKRKPVDEKTGKEQEEQYRQFMEHLKKHKFGGESNGVE